MKTFKTLSKPLLLNRNKGNIIYIFDTRETNKYHLNYE